MTDERLTYLLDKHTNSILTTDEVLELSEWLRIKYPIPDKVLEARLKTFIRKVKIGRLLRPETNKEDLKLIKRWSKKIGTKALDLFKLKKSDNVQIRVKINGSWDKFRVNEKTLTKILGGKFWKIK